MPPFAASFFATVVISVRYGGSVWESNPPFDPLRTESPALKAGEVTGPLSPPHPEYHRDKKVIERRLRRSERDVVEGGGREREGAPAGYCQPNVNALRHAHRLAGPQLHPVHTIWGTVHREHVPASSQFYPIRQGPISQRLVRTAGSR